MHIFPIYISFQFKRKEVYRFLFFFQAEDGIRDGHVTGVQTCALPISYTCSSTTITGASPQAPRHATVSTVNIMSGVVLFFSLVPIFACSAFRIGHDCLTW